LRLLRQLQAQERTSVSCTVLAEFLRRDATQVRKDLSYTGIAGKPKVGYQLDGLIQAIERFLGWDNVSEAFLVGVGNLGRALLGYDGFSSKGLSIVAAFDVDERKVGTEIHGRHVLALDRLPGLAQRLHVSLGIITTPGEGAQGVADAMVSGGIRAIWNFAPVLLSVPEHVVVENEQLSASLAVISQRLAKARMQQGNPLPD
jgi:redox-sensing transcriptional repressor